jgi:hypothetical protein
LTRLGSGVDALAIDELNPAAISPTDKRTESMTLACFAQTRLELWTLRLTWRGDEIENMKCSLITGVLQG